MKLLQVNRKHCEGIEGESKVEGVGCVCGVITIKGLGRIGIWFVIYEDLQSGEKIKVLHLEVSVFLHVVCYFLGLKFIIDIGIHFYLQPHEEIYGTY